jgi:hypothetical protein
MGLSAEMVSCTCPEGVGVSVGVEMFDWPVDGDEMKAVLVNREGDCVGEA